MNRSPMQMRCLAIFGAALLLAVPADARAQVRASEPAIVAQTANGTQFRVEYFRPKVRGRNPLFGKEVPWGKLWTPGANWATTFEVNHDVTLDGHAVPRGKYSVWFLVQPDAWTIVLDPRFSRYHEDRPDSIAAQIRWTVRSGQGPFTEELTWSFPDVTPEGAVLEFAWERRRVALDLVVPSKYQIPTARALAEPILGTYEWVFAETGATVMQAEFYYEGGMVKQRYTPFPTWYHALQNQPMVRINEGWFIPAIIENGRILEMVSDFVFEFTIKDGKAVSFEIRDDRDNLLGSGKRLLRP